MKKPNWISCVDIASKYFNHFNNQDLKSLSELYDEDIVLKDWLSEHNGKQAVLEAAERAFTTLKQIKIVVKNIYEIHDKGVACEIDIHILDHEAAHLLRVVDVLDINDNAKITEIRAYILNP